LGNILYENQRVQFNETGLRESRKIATANFPATDTESLEQIFNDIDKLEKSTVSVKKYQQYRDLFPLCLMGGCGLLRRKCFCHKRFGKNCRDRVASTHQHFNDGRARHSVRAEGGVQGLPAPPFPQDSTNRMTFAHQYGFGDCSYPALDCALHARGTSRTETACSSLFPRASAAARRNGQSAAAHYQIWLLLLGLRWRSAVWRNRAWVTPLRT